MAKFLLVNLIVLTLLMFHAQAADVDELIRQHDKEIGQLKVIVKELQVLYLAIEIS